MFNATTITITDDMTDEQIMDVLSQDAAIVFDARMKPVTEFVPDLIKRAYAQRKIKEEQAQTEQAQRTPKAIEI